MTLVSMLRQKLADERPCAERHDWQVTDPAVGSALTLAITQRDGLSSLLWELHLRRTAPPGESVRRWAERIAGRVTSLLEPLQVLEVDTLRNQAILRSTLAAEDRQSPTYFEILLDGAGAAQVRRYQASHAVDAAGRVAKREQVAFALTHEGLLKLVGDLV